MALVVEDGTGLSTAESYLSVAALRQRALSLGLGYIVDSSAMSDAAVEGALRRATSLLDSLYEERYVGWRRSVEQALAWPRRDASPTGLGVGEILPPVGVLAAQHGYYVVGGRRRRGYVGVAPRPRAFLPLDGLPRALLDAVVHAAVREAASPGSLSPDEYAGITTQETIGPITVKYEGGRGTGGGVPQIIESTLRPLMSRGSGSVADFARS